MALSPCDRAGHFGSDQCRPVLAVLRGSFGNDGREMNDLHTPLARRGEEKSRANLEPPMGREGRMGKENKTNEPAVETDGGTKQVGVRLTPEELEAVKTETGATAEATAVACFVRRKLRERTPNE